jgi:hypothetical protein
MGRVQTKTKLRPNAWGYRCLQSKDMRLAPFEGITEVDSHLLVQFVAQPRGIV